MRLIIPLILLLTLTAQAAETEKSAQDKLIDTITTSIKQHPKDWKFAKETGTINTISYLYYKDSKLIITIHEDRISIGHPIKISLTKKNQNKIRELIYKKLTKIIKPTDPPKKE